MTTLSPVNAAPILRVEKLFIERNIGANLRIFFRGRHLAVVHEDYFRRDPGAAFCALILIELDVRRRGAILARWSKQSHEVELFLIDPELRRMEVALLRSDHICWSA